MRLLERIRNRPKPLRSVASASEEVEAAAAIIGEIAKDVAVVVDDWRAKGQIEVLAHLPLLPQPLRITIPIAEEP